MAGLSGWTWGTSAGIAMVWARISRAPDLPLAGQADVHLVKLLR